MGDLTGAFQILDWELDPALPRLVLYSAVDRLIVADRVEAYIEHIKLYRPEATMLTAKLAASPHCENWFTELPGCATAVSSLLKVAGVMPGGGPDFLPSGLP